MDPELIEKITASPSLPWVFTAIGFHVINAFLGTFMAFVDRTDLLVKIHRWVYISVLVSLAGFLVLNHIHSANTPWDYLIFIYFITIIPISKRWDVLVHALFSIVGLTLLPVLILLQLF
ncbi:MAG: hypothetical protein ACE5E9_03570 [Nitrospinaceae bacterium]